MNDDARASDELSVDATFTVSLRILYYDYAYAPMKSFLLSPYRRLRRVFRRIRRFARDARRSRPPA
jgi:hypothetical protein|tara:strand:- start:404 stop:601 length:198 start_codon:yes stop_codon:yes gene_type:complete